MRLRPVIITLMLTAACSDERGLPAGFLERAAQTEPTNNVVTSTSPTGDATHGEAADTASAQDRSDVQATPEPPEPPILTGPAAEDPATVTESDRATATVVASVTKDLGLGAPPAVATPPGDAPHQKLAQDRKFDAFRAECARYHQLRKALLPYGHKLAEGAATPDERREHDRIEAAAKAEQQRLSRMMWRGGLTADDRAAMSWIMFGPTAAMPKLAP